MAHWPERRYKKLDDYIRAAEDYPNDIRNIAEWADCESGFGEKKLLEFYNTLLDRGILDMDARIFMFGNSLLLASIQDNYVSIVKMLLSRGANVHIRNNYDEGIIDMILRCGSKRYTTRVLHLLNTVYPYFQRTNEEVEIHNKTRMSLNSKWKHYKHYLNNTDIVIILQTMNVI
jgi:hypothetical protein